MGLVVLSKIIAILALLCIAWLPIEIGIQALHRKQDGRPLEALFLLALGLVANVAAIAMVGPRFVFILSNLG